MKRKRTRNGGDDVFESDGEYLPFETRRKKTKILGSCEVDVKVTAGRRNKKTNVKTMKPHIVTSKYVGVSCHRNRWKVCRTVGGETFHAQSFELEKEKDAGIAADQILIDYALNHTEKELKIHRLSREKLIQKLNFSDEGRKILEREEAILKQSKEKLIFSGHQPPPPPPVVAPVPIEEKKKKKTSGNKVNVKKQKQKMKNKEKKIKQKTKKKIKKIQNKKSVLKKIKVAKDIQSGSYQISPRTPTPTNANIKSPDDSDFEISPDVCLTEAERGFKFFTSSKNSLVNFDKDYKDQNWTPTKQDFEGVGRNINLTKTNPLSLASIFSSDSKNIEENINNNHEKTQMIKTHKKLLENSFAIAEVAEISTLPENKRSFNSKLNPKRSPKVSPKIPILKTIKNNYIPSFPLKSLTTLSCISPGPPSIFSSNFLASCPKFIMDPSIMTSRMKKYASQCQSENVYSPPCPPNFPIRKFKNKNQVKKFLKKNNNKAPGLEKLTPLRNIQIKKEKKEDDDDVEILENYHPKQKQKVCNTAEIITSFPSISNAKQRELDFLTKRTQMKLEFQKKINLKKKTNHTNHNNNNAIPEISNDKDDEEKINNHTKEQQPSSSTSQNHYKLCETKNNKIFDNNGGGSVQNIDIFTLVKKEEEEIKKLSTLYSQMSKNNKSSEKNEQTFEASKPIDTFSMVKNVVKEEERINKNITLCLESNDESDKNKISKNLEQSKNSSTTTAAVVTTTPISSMPTLKQFSSAILPTTTIEKCDGKKKRRQYFKRNSEKITQDLMNEEDHNDDVDMVPKQILQHETFEITNQLEKGIIYDQKEKKWIVLRLIGGKLIYGGIFESLEEAQLKIVLMSFSNSSENISVDQSDVGTKLKNLVAPKDKEILMTSGALESQNIAPVVVGKENRYPAFTDVNVTPETIQWLLSDTNHHSGNNYSGQEFGKRKPQPNKYKFNFDVKEQAPLIAGDLPPKSFSDYDF